MKRKYRFSNHFTTLSVVFLLAGTTFLVGCTDSFVAADEEAHDASALQRTLQTGPSKLRNAHLFDRIISTYVQNADGSFSKTGDDDDGGEAITLIIAMDETVLGPDKLLSRAKLLSRLKLLSRHEYDEVFFGLAAEVDLDQLDSLLQVIENDAEIDWVEFDLPFTEVTYTTTGKNGNKKQVIPWGIERIK